MNSQELIELLNKYHEATNTGNLAEYDNLFAEDFVNIAPGFPPINGIADMKNVILALRNAFPDLHITVEDIFAEDNKVASRWNLQGTQTGSYEAIPATGLKIYAEGIHIDHIVNGKISKRWAYNNFQDIFAKLKAQAKSK
jgi:steroid delta-isomerase-like uncharacterized protein